MVEKTRSNCNDVRFLIILQNIGTSAGDVDVSGGTAGLDHALGGDVVGQVVSVVRGVASD